MTRPADVPEDVPVAVWSKAMVAVSELNLVADLHHLDHLILVESHARAILADRERCGNYATDQAEREPYGHSKAAAYLIADNIMGAK